MSFNLELVVYIKHIYTVLNPEPETFSVSYSSEIQGPCLDRFYCFKICIQLALYGLEPEPNARFYTLTLCLVLFNYCSMLFNMQVLA